MIIQERVHLWAVNANGETFQLGAGRQRASVSETRAIVAACNPEEAKAEALASSFLVGIKNATNDEPAEITISGEIGDPYTMCDAKSVQNFMRANKGRSVVARINSGGGLAWDGIAMHNAFRDHDAEVTAIIESIAGSAATLPAVGAGSTRIYENAQFFIHRAALLAYGNRDAMSEAIDWLDAVDAAIAATYKAKTNKAMDRIKSQMAGEGKRDGTVFTAREAVAEKYCNEVISLKGSAKNLTPFDDQPHSVELARAIRMRTRAGLFAPADSTTGAVK